MDMKSNNVGSMMLKWMKDMWEFPRSITGHGTHATLDYLKQLNNDLNIHKIQSGTKVFDWEIPDEWNIYDAYIMHESGKRFAEFSKNNLHILGYSLPCNMEVSLDELLEHIYTEPNQPNVIPYVTSYYKNRWGFCMSENEKNTLPAGTYRVVIDATKEPGSLEYADLVIKGKSKKEIFFSTYICHPSMANNELSGPVLASAIIKYLLSNYQLLEYSYRFVFSPETIGSIAYLSKNIKHLKENVVCGFNLSCVGDNRAYSHIESRKGDSLADIALKAGLIDLKNVTVYPFLERGSDERQYCAPGVDLPFCGFARTKYGEYPEYHTSADNFDVVSEEGLGGAFDVMKSIIDAFEMKLYPIAKNICEPQLGKYNLYPTVSQKGGHTDIIMRLNFLAYSDGSHSLFDISNKIQKNIKLVVLEAKTLQDKGLITMTKERSKEKFYNG
jgi:aminopeptidase-like protein